MSLVGLLAFILAIPMSVIANLLTPRVQSWWAMTSVSRRKQRIEAIKEKVALYDSRPAHWADILRRLLVTFLIILAAGSVGLGGFLVELHAHIHRLERALKIRDITRDALWENRAILQLAMVASSFVAGFCATYMVFQVWHLSPEFIKRKKESLLEDLAKLSL